MRPTQAPELIDDLDFATLASSLKTNIEHLKQRTEPTLFFGPQQIRREDYIRALESLAEAADQDPSGALFKKHLLDKFATYEVYGQDKWGEVFVTSYFEPVIEGRLKPTEIFTRPLYGPPKNTVILDLASFERNNLSIFKNQEGPTQMRALLVSNGKAQKVVAFPDRETIEQGAIRDTSEILAWVDPVDAFFLEIQGSGVVHLGKGRELRIGYAAHNGHPYVPIGRFLWDQIPRETMTLHNIESHLRSLASQDAQKLMNLNPSYVFFRQLEGAGLTYFGTEVIAGRTIATDPTYFPKGALAFLQFDKPVFANATDLQPHGFSPTSRFVFDHDKGGAIRGPHRVDLFWGRGLEAKRNAGVMKNKGRLYYFVPKS